MKSIKTVLMLLLIMIAGSTNIVMAKSGGTTLQDGVLTYSAGSHLAGQPIPVGYDIYGYNYQAHMFNGLYANAYLNRYGYPPYDPANEAAYVAANPTVVSTWVWPYRNIQLTMKWNDAWLSNMDRDGDGKLDRHYGSSSYIGSGAWETNHMSGANNDGTKWTDFIKIVAVPSDATKIGGIWYTVGGVEIGHDIWGEFALIQEVYNDPSTGDHGLLYKSPGPVGFGYYQH